MTHALRIAVAEDEPNMREYLEEVLPRLGHQVVAARGGRQLIELCKLSTPDLILTDVRMDDMDGLDAAAEVNREHRVPVVVISAHHEPEVRERAAADFIVGYLVKPVKQADLETTIDLALLRFQQMEGLRREAADLRQTLDDRKTIERAKGIVMRRIGVDEPESYRRMRKLSSNLNYKLVEIARTVLEAEEVFAQLEADARPPAARARPETTPARAGNGASAGGAIAGGAHEAPPR